MSQEIVYTSAPRGLKPGSKGFCTVVSTHGMAGNFSERLEILSGYRHAFTPGNRNAPVNYSHLHIKVSEQTYYVLSRICDAGVDYSQRSNKLAHHVALSASELVAAGPAAVLAHGGFCESRWDGRVRTLPVGRSPNAPCSGPGVCSAWKRLTGDAGWAAVLAHSATAAKPRPVSVIFPAGTDTLALVVEALNLVSPAQRWNVTFSTYFTRSVAGSDCLWRFVLNGTKQASSLRNNSTELVIELDTELKAPPQTPFLSSARTGRSHVGYNAHFVPPSGTGSDPYARLRASRKPQVSFVSGPGRFDATGPAGSINHYQNMPAMPDLLGRRHRWYKRKLSWLLLGLLSLTVIGGLVLAAFYAGKNAGTTTVPELPVAPAVDNDTSADVTFEIRIAQNTPTLFRRDESYRTLRRVLGISQSSLRTINWVFESGL